MSRQPQPSDAFFQQYAECCAHAALFELKARVLAEQSERLARRAVSEELTPLVRDLVDEHAARLEGDERTLLLALPGIRNKLFHAELSRAIGRLRRFDEELISAGVVKLDLDAGESSLVANTSTERSGVMGWLLESALRGGFRSGVERFAHGIALIERLLGIYPPDAFRARAG